ncbi:signal transduction histidine kinase/CheY-like chemotaxis protein/purine-cytosine permease-like protein [Paucibacter oligotrophus]|uniref:Virulence sensor protein BvgS n=1 Tax=Roseateles oligotrophus TaxID=1769250 RepID=A0A840L981_9BURK|nr:ATP-binding protein [Roseateles oligotrophus]MBB4842689.1 signal transduction histidine kinase/CheY-like chemotaxis protein/purine-cytosine permease-like protein [Roseateles oligotrophus]
MHSQKIFKVRREYNSWVANESMEDFALRYTPRSFRKWSTWRVGNTAYGGASFLALEAIGATLALKYGFSNAVWAIASVALICFLSGLPISYYAARYGLDMDLLTRGAGFGYMGSTITSLIYASFTFIFFALETAILATALHLLIPLPMMVLYLLCSLLILPLVARGITLLSRLQLWTQPLWLALLLLPYLVIYWKQPQLVRDFALMTGLNSGSSRFDPLMFGAAVTVAFSLVVQIGEQVDYLRFLPEQTPANRWRWWLALVVAGPGWILPGALKLLGGAFLAFLMLEQGHSAQQAVQPTQMYLSAYAEVFDSPAWVLAATVLFVVVSQVKINVTNAYAGSLAWSNFFARLTHSHPGRVVWLVFNVLIALLLITLGVFQILDQVLSLYSNLAVAWVGALVADLVVNKPLGLSPPGIEFKRAHLYDINPVGLGAMLLATAIATLAYLGLLGPGAEAFSSFIALGLAFVLSPLLAWASGGRYYLARAPAQLAAPGASVECSICEQCFEVEDMAYCPAYGTPICSLCCTLESRCHDRCKQHARAAEQASHFLSALLPQVLARRVNFRVSHYLLVFLSLCTLVGSVIGAIYWQAGSTQADVAARALLAQAFVKAGAMLLLIIAVLSWWVVLNSQAKQLAQEDSNRQNELLRAEIDAHQRTDAALQHAKEVAEAANQAKTRYVAGLSHELRTPLNSILGYSNLLLKNPQLPAGARDGLGTIQRSGQHLCELVDELLDLARIEAERLQLEAVAQHLPQLLQDVLRMVRPQAEAKGLAFHYREAGDLPQWIEADSKRLRQVLLNLLGNAVRFTVSGAIHLTVTRPDAEGELLRFEVRDSGPGIAAADQQRIFEPFEQGHERASGGEPGAGLGLTITDKLVRLMGGRISLHSRVGEGSCFAVELPLPTRPPPARRRQPRREIIGYAGPRQHLLIVDDQADQRALLRQLLEPLGFEVSEADSGEQCLELMAQAPADLLLLDIGMRPLDGWQTAERLRGGPCRQSPIIMVTANLFEDMAQRLQACGCQALVAKPLQEPELLQAIQAALGLRWVRRAPAVPADDGQALEQDWGEDWEQVPQELRQALLRLLDSGHVRGLGEALQALAQEYPATRALCLEMQAQLSRFELDALQARLRKVCHAEH